MLRGFKKDKNPWAYQVQVTGSSGDIYNVGYRQDGTWGCSCKGWIFSKPRADCKHIEAIKKLNAQVAARDKTQYRATFPMNEDKAFASVAQSVDNRQADLDKAFFKQDWKAAEELLRLKREATQRLLEQVLQNTEPGSGALAVLKAAYEKELPRVQIAEETFTVEPFDPLKARRKIKLA